MLRQRRPRILAPKHLAWIRSLPSIIPGQGPVEAAHVRYGERIYGKPPTGMGEKPSDCWVVPLAHDVHMEQHRHGERAWWIEQAIDPLLVAALLWAAGGNDEAGINIIRNAWLISLRKVA
jgi:hypothetical protein